MTGALRIIPAGDSALLVEFEDRIAPLVNARAIALAGAIEAARLTGLREVVPTYRSVALYFDPLRTDADALAALIHTEAARPVPSSTDARAPLRVPVCYGADLGPDLADVAAAGGVTPDEVVRLHTAEHYRVFMMGFVPGFAYMGTVDDRIAAPRKTTPRVRVPAGSVGIAGRQTGVYPMETPGGWQLVGRTPLRVYDPGRAEPFLFQAGDSVEFYAIDRDEYDQLRSRQGV